MSYCRWSTDDFQCDLYCYEHVDGTWTTHVATNRPVWTPPEGGTLLDLPKHGEPKEAFEAWAAKHNAYHDALDKAERVNIGGPYDGQTFKDATLADFKARLLHLREAGYNFPDYVLETVDEEMAEEAAEIEDEPYENTLSLEELRREVRRLWDRENALTAALRDLPEVPHWRVLYLLSHAAKWPDDNNVGRRMQREHGLDKIAPRSEAEGGAGLWSHIRAGVLAARATPLNKEEGAET